MVYEERPYQIECANALIEAEKSGRTRGLVVMASGLGKTLTAAFYLQRILRERPDTRVLVLCHQEGILLQSKDKFKLFFGEEYSYGMFTGNSKTRRSVSFLFSTFQTMRDHCEQFRKDTFDYVIVDEAHHTPAETYQPTAEYFTPRFLLGLTATKDRTDGQDLLDIYGEIIYSMDIFDGWTEGWLAPVDYRIMLDDLSKEEFEKYVGPQAGNEKVSIAQLNKTIFAPRRDEEIVASIREQTADMDDPSMFVFCASIEHAKAMVHQFGGQAAVVHSGQSANINNAVLEDFRTGKIRIILSVNMLNEGIDVPETSVVVFLRGTDSSAVFWQQLGRGLRISGEKRVVRVLDYVANIERIIAVLEMEETSRKRIQTNLKYPSAVSRPEPMMVNIPVTKFSVTRVDLERLIQRIRKGWEFRTDDELLADFKRKSDELGGLTPTKNDINNDPNMASARTYTVRFGSLARVAKLVGLTPTTNDYSEVSDDEILDMLRDKAHREGKETITQKDLRNDPSMPSADLIATRFGGLVNALRLAGLQLSVNPPYTDEELIYLYRKKGIDEYGGEAPTSIEIANDPKMPDYSTFIQHFKSMENLRIRAGLARRRSNPLYWKNATDEECLEALRQKAERDGGYITCKSLSSDSTVPSYREIKRRFGSLDNAKRKAGIPEMPRKVRRRLRPRRDNLSRESLIAEAQEVVVINRRRLKTSDFANNPKLHGRCVYKKYFGSGKVGDINEYIGADRILAKLQQNN